MIDGGQEPTPRKPNVDYNKNWFNWFVGGSADDGFGDCVEINT